MAALLLAGVAAPAQRLDPAKWKLTVQETAAPPGATVHARLHVKLEPGWHLYSPTTPAGGPIPTTIEVAENPAIESYELYQRPPVRRFDPNFQIETETYEEETDFLLAVKLAEEASAGRVELTARVRYQLCDDKQCLPPKRKTASAMLRIDPAARVPPGAVPAGFIAARPGAGAEAEPAGAAASGSPGVPEAGGGGGRQGLTAFLLVAFGFGLAGIFTPCVFPMIPITMSYFLKKEAGGRRESIVQAVVFCGGIIVLFSTLGLITTAILGPFGVVRLGSNPWVNGFIALVFLLFGLSLLGAFEIAVPSGVLTRLNAASGRGGYLGTLLMGLTFSLAAFACVGPFVGTLLAASIQGGALRPLFGMLAFATGLAAPFFFLALFPAYLQRMPKAGNWMVRVKIVLGFVILAAMLKYFSNVDQVLGWGLLSRDRFLAAWVVLFAAAGLYLLGFLHLEGVEPDQKVGVARLLTGLVFLVFAASLIPGMFGARLGELDAYVPAPEPGRSLISAGQGQELNWMKNQYREALAAARAEGKLVLVNFTGYACTNCHWMKANMFPRPEIASALSRFIRVELYTDGTDEASAQNQTLQEEKFATVAIPYYAILDPEENIIATFAGLTRDPEEFLAFLRTPAAGSPVP